jgi:hypothetical protein
MIFVETFRKATGICVRQGARENVVQKINTARKTNAFARSPVAVVQRAVMLRCYQ